MADRVCKKVDSSDLLQKYGYDPLKQIGKEKVNGVSFLVITLIKEIIN